MSEHAADTDSPIRLVAIAVHEDICGCEHGYLRHGRTYTETAHVVVNALRDDGWRVVPPAEGDGFEEIDAKTRDLLSAMFGPRVTPPGEGRP